MRRWLILFVVSVVVVIVVVCAFESLSRHWCCAKSALEVERWLYFPAFTGNLGNKMFQWAALRSMALRSGRDILVSPAVFEDLRWMKDQFPCLELARVIIAYEAPYIDHIFPEPSNFQYSEEHMHNQLDRHSLVCCIQLGPSCLLQSFRYFDSHWPLVRREFEFPVHVIAAEAQTMLNIATSTENATITWVGVHVRRGDHLQGDYGLFSMSQLCEYIQWMWDKLHNARKLPNVTFMIVSDDLAWCEQVLVSLRHRSTPIRVQLARSSNSTTPLNDLCLLSLCDHFILSPSTFGWWGAALSRRFGDSNQIVIVHPTWFHPLGKLKHLESHTIPFMDWFCGLPDEVTCLRYPMKFTWTYYDAFSQLDYQPKYVRLVSEGKRHRMLVFDMFLEYDQLVLTSTFYGEDDAKAVDIHLHVQDGSRLVLTTEVAHNGYEPHRSLFYALPAHLRNEQMLEVTVCYREIKQTHVISIQTTSDQDSLRGKSQLAFGTLFHNDLRCIPLTHRFYQKQGVDRYWLYYNGELSDVWQSLSHAPDVRYRSWPFRYWNCDLNRRSGLTLHAHHAQTTFLSCLRHRHLHASEYLIVADLDEWIASFDDMRLLDYLKQSDDDDANSSRNTTVRYVSNSFCKFNLETLVMLEENLAMTQLRLAWEQTQGARRYGWAQRTKAIYRNTFQGEIAIHLAACAPDDHYYNDDHLSMMHFINYYHHDRDGRNSAFMGLDTKQFVYVI